MRFEDLIINHDRKRVPLSSSQREKMKGEYPYYGAQGIIDYVDDYIFDGEYLLIAEDGENLLSNRLPLSQIAKGRFWVNNHAHIVTAQADNDLHFLHYYINNTDISSYVTGSAQPKLNQANLNMISCFVPPLCQQKVIATILSKIDEKIALNSKINDNLEQQAQAIFKSWFVDFEPFRDGKFVESELGLIPEGWQVGYIGDICAQIYSGGTPSTSQHSYWNGDIPWLSSGETRNRFIILTEKTITQSGIDNSSTRLAHRNDIVIASAGQGFTRGQVSMILLDTYVNQSVIVLSSEKNIQPFLLCNLASRYDELRGISDGSSVRGSLTTKMLARFPTIIPPQDILDSFSTIVYSFIDQIENNLLSVRKLASLRDTLLPKLMSGEIDVSNITI